MQALLIRTALMYKCSEGSMGYIVTVAAEENKFFI
ncbi:unnamed protein product [Phyllotreta striolata]|uniref:Uncharacterized protein n=1 Tax=Phyllotreta striolata TaxID=444603 RepID=A0A9N9TKH6_PHYSR|nr:unnamed protein product [Phyllotreta striolata]